MSSDWLRIDSIFGPIAVEFSNELTGRDAKGRRTVGAVVQILLPGTADPMFKQSRRLQPAATAARTSIVRWLEGDVNALDAVGVVYRGSDFQQQVLKEMRRIKAGQVATYGELAAAAGHPNAARAVGTVCATNQIPLVIPCHRVVRAGGQIEEYAGRPEMKRALLQLEGWSGAANAR